MYLIREEIYRGEEFVIGSKLLGLYPLHLHHVYQQSIHYNLEIQRQHMVDLFISFF